MEISSTIHMEVKKDERVYSLCIPAGAPYGELYDAVYEMLQETSKMATEAVKKAERVQHVEEDKEA